MSQHHTQYGDLPLYIGGEACPSASDEWIEVTDPADQSLLARVPKATSAEIELAVRTAHDAYLQWREVPPSERARVMFNYQHLLKVHHDELATLLAQETGKNLADAKGDVWRGIEVVEQACGIASQTLGETMGNVARRVDGHSWVQPLGVCVGITPFNFPAMIPLWMFPLAVACGNGFVLKPSEQDPLTPMRLAELFTEAGPPRAFCRWCMAAPSRWMRCWPIPMSRQSVSWARPGSAATSIAAPRRNSSGPSVLSAPRITW